MLNNGGVHHFFYMVDNRLSEIEDNLGIKSNRFGGHMREEDDSELLDITSGEAKEFSEEYKEVEKSNNDNKEWNKIVRDITRQSKEGRNRLEIYLDSDEMKDRILPKLEERNFKVEPVNFDTAPEHRHRYWVIWIEEEKSDVNI